ncbi:MAG: tRNA (adenosine(37)-N6)-dimethylallyltransferase MiaA [Clostridiales bacterium]|jgi:tRNA dimethylallyltransferase|nr:tRNA (adenosine(37)-N6)-dimethylallyltransferase MiaA [Clostridiales bacterium]
MKETDGKKSTAQTKLIVIAGPTAVGKSGVAVNLAQRLNGEIIGADSMQVYRGMNIGTGKLSAAEMKGIPHHCIDIAHPGEDFTVKDFADAAKAAVDRIAAKGKTPIMTGGTGLYINAFLNGYSLSGAGKSEAYRETLRAAAREDGGEALYRRLAESDPQAAAKIDKNDLKRVIRALEIRHLTGESKSASAQKAPQSPYAYRVYILSRDREALYARINARVDKMMADGLLQEAKSLLAYRNCNSMQALGYKQIFAYLDGEIATEEALVALIKQKTRNYAKRQLTFFRGMPLAHKEWLDADDERALLQKAQAFIDDTA